MHSKQFENLVDCGPLHKAQKRCHGEEVSGWLTTLGFQVQTVRSKCKGKRLLRKHFSPYRCANNLRVIERLLELAAARRFGLAGTGFIGLNRRQHASNASAYVERRLFIQVQRRGIKRRQLDSDSKKMSRDEVICTIGECYQPAHAPFLRELRTSVHDGTQLEDKAATKCYKGVGMASRARHRRSKH